MRARGSFRRAFNVALPASEWVHVAVSLGAIMLKASASSYLDQLAGLF